MAWWYLSFAGDQWLGAALVEADTFAGAVARSWRLGINPGGDVKGAELRQDVSPPVEVRDRLLSREELISEDKARGGSGKLVEF